MHEPIIRVEDMSIERPGAGAVLNGISFEIRSGEILSIVGSSGTGKSTLLSALAGLLKPTVGKIYFRDNEVRKPRVEVGLVFQNYALFPWRTALENVAFGLEIKGIPKSQKLKIASEALDLMGLLEHRDKYPTELSGGMQQRVAIARELVVRPDVLMLDEGFSALDVQTRRKTEEYIVEIQKKLGITVILVTHLVDQALAYSDRVIVLNQGKIIKTLELHSEKPRDVDAASFRKLLRSTEALIKPPSKSDVFVSELEMVEKKKK